MTLNNKENDISLQMDITASTAYEWSEIHHAEHDCLHIVTLFLIYIKINIPHEF